MEQLDRIKPTGVTLKEVLQDNHRHAVFLIEQDGQDRIYKSANSDEIVANINQSISNYHHLSVLCSQNPNSVFRPRKVFQFNADEGWFIGENFDTPALFSKQPIDDHELAAEKVATYLAPFLYEASTYTASIFTDVSLYSQHNPSPEKRPENRMRVLSAWAMAATRASLVSSRDASKILDFISHNLVSIKTGVELVDLSTWEMFILSDGRLGIIDLEHFDPAGRRHFDVAWQYSKLWTIQQSPQAARRLLSEYRALGKDEKDLDTALLTMLLMRLLGTLYDATVPQLIQDASPEDEMQAVELAKQMVPEFIKLDIDALC